MRTCQYCKLPFTVLYSNQQFCSPECALKVADSGYFATEPSVSRALKKQAACGTGECSLSFTGHGQVTCKLCPTCTASKVADPVHACLICHQPFVWTSKNRKFCPTCIPTKEDRYFYQLYKVTRQSLEVRSGGVCEHCHKAPAFKPAPKSKLYVCRACFKELTAKAKAVGRRVWGQYRAAAKTLKRQGAFESYREPKLADVLKD